MLDETFGGIDSEGQESIVKILENLGITVIMITQNISSEFNNDNKLIVVKENGESKFI
jgi:ABC-type Mn2+/Zn2+ transport system ATPase subunit